MLFTNVDRFWLLVAPRKSEVEGHWLDTLTRTLTPAPCAALTRFADWVGVMFVSAQSRLALLMGATFQCRTCVTAAKGIWLGCMVESALGKYPELQCG